MTLLYMGKTGYTNLLRERKEMVGIFREKLEGVAKRHGERVLVCPSNTISFGMTLGTIARGEGEKEQAEVRRSTHQNHFCRYTCCNYYSQGVP